MGNGVGVGVDSGVGVRVGVSVGTGVILGVGCAVAVGTGGGVGVAESAGVTASAAWPATPEAAAATEVGVITWVGREATGPGGVAPISAGAATRVTGWPESVTGEPAAGPAVGPHPAAASSKMAPHSPSSSRWYFSPSGIRPPVLPWPHFVPRI